MECVFNPANEVSCVRLINEKLVMVMHKLEEDFIETNSRLNVVIAAYVTAQARMKLYTYIRQLQERVLYFDTGENFFFIVLVMQKINSFAFQTPSST